jgi:hypothetical protein
MTKVQEIARAIQDGITSGDSDWDSMAIAVLIIMRHPTKAMIEAGMDKTDWPICDAEVEHRYQAMIDAAMIELEKPAE